MFLSTWVAEYLTGIDNEKSSKRLIGVKIGLSFDLLCWVGGVFAIVNRDFDSLLEILWVMVAFGGSLLGMSTIERVTRNTPLKNVEKPLDTSTK
jgi:hypothetical protein